MNVLPSRTTVICVPAGSSALMRSISARTPSAVLTGFASLRFWSEMLTAGSPLNRAICVASLKPSRTVAISPRRMAWPAVKRRNSSISAVVRYSPTTRTGTSTRASVTRPDGTDTFSAWIRLTTSGSVTS
jgi:hypothetical protein